MYFIVITVEQGSATSFGEISMGISAWKSSPVWSLVYFWKDRDRDQSTFIQDLKKTGPDCKRPKTAVFCSL